MPLLFEDYTLLDLPLKNRIVMAPMSRARAKDKTREPTKVMREYYEQRSSAGLTIVEATHVSTNSVSRPCSPAIDRDDKISAWSTIPNAIHQNNGAVFLQLYHVGRKAAKQQMPNGEPPFAPSAIRANGNVTTAVGKQDFSMPREMTRLEIDDVITEFKLAAIRATKAGFDGVELHAGNGYLIDQFIRNATNHRSDGYGGSINNRIRLLSEIIDEIEGSHPGIKLGIRVTPRDMSDGCRDSRTIELFSDLTKMLNGKKIAYIHVNEGVSSDNQYDMTPMIRAIFNGRLIACSGFTKHSAEMWLAANKADLIAFGTHFIANPDLPERLEQNVDLAIPKREYYRRGGAKGYTDYCYWKQQ